jgi:hypothetical protein
MKTRCYAAISAFLLLVAIDYAVAADFVLPKTLSAKTDHHQPSLQFHPSPKPFD